MSANGSGSPQPWRHNNGNTNKTNEGNDRMINPTHSQHSQQSHHRHPSHHHHHHHQERLHERDRDKNHETVCNLLSMLTLGIDQQSDASVNSAGTSASNVDHNRMLLLNLTNSPESCIALRRAGCIPLLIEILHPPSSPPPGIRPPEIIKTRAARALKNIVQYNPDEKLKRKELRVLKLLEGIRAFSEAVRSTLQVLAKESGNQKTVGTTTSSNDGSGTVANVQDVSSAQQHPTANMMTLIKMSFDEEHRNIMCLLGAIHALAELIVCDHLIHGNSAPQMKDECLAIRRYSGMTLTNLTFGDGTNKALLCGMREFMGALVAQLECDNEEVCQVTASLLRNLSWHADSTSRASLRESNAVPKLTLAAIKSTKESTLKATLSALWNLSAHSIPNKTAICTASPESLPFLISLLRPNNPLLKTLKTPMTIVENAGGILRNISTEIKSSPELRKVLREHRCYEILLEHLKSCSLSVVSNACGTLWNLSGGVGCEEDQRKLLDLNAVPMLKNLIYSKHERISQGASAALRNLLSSRFAKDHMLQLDTRMTAHIYSPNSGANNDRGNCPDPSQESPGSDGDCEFEFGGGNAHHPLSSYQQQQQQIVHHPPMVHQEPPVAHQQSSAAAASIFQRMHAPPAHSVTPVPPPHYHVAPTNFAHPASYVMNRPTSINYSIETEPLDLTVTSSKSSPIHVISAAEFGGLTGHHSHLHHSQHRKPKSAQFSHNAHYQQQHNSSGSQKPFFNPPAMLHHPSTSSASQSSSPMRFTYPGAKFNRSCPEILSRLNSAGHPQMAQMNTFGIEPKPLDFSSNSSPTPSGTSSMRGAGEAPGSHNDSASGGDTTFNYSLQFTEEDEDDRGTGNGNGESASKSEDTLKTYCYEGTPHNFSISNSCQDLVHEIELEKVAASSTSEEKGDNSSHANKAAKLQPIDETPKSYYVENTPAVFSRTSSLSSIASGGLNAGENKAEPIDSECQGLPDEKKGEVFGDDCQGAGFGDHMQQQLHPPKRRSGPQHGSFTPARVTFSAEETPLMFSRCSSVASLDSLDVGVVGGNGGGNGLASHNDDDLSDFSRRASEVVSPTESELPDSPHDIVPPQRVYEQPTHQSKRDTQEEKQDGEDDVKVFSIEEKSGLNSCRSLSPLMIDGEELPVLSKRKMMLQSDQSQSHENGTGGSVAERTAQTSDRHTPPDSSTVSNSENKDQPDKKKTNAFPDDEVKVFALEGTPFYGVSNATSLSDLTMDLDTEEPPKSGEKKKPVPVNAGARSTEGEIRKPITSVPVAGMSTEVDSKRDEPIYSDVQLLQKCIRIGKSVGIPKSKSEYKIMTHSESMEQMSMASNISGSSTSLTKPSTSGATKKKPLVESKSHQDFDDPDLAALIMKGRNRPKEKERSSSKINKTIKHNVDKDNSSKSSNTKSSSESESSKLVDENSKPLKENVRIEVKEVDEKNPVECESKPNEPSDSSAQEQTSTQEYGESNAPVAEENKLDVSKTELKIDNLNIDPSQISTTSLGSEWNDETPTFSSPIPSMSISTAFKIVGGGGADESSCSKPPPALPPKANKAITASMQSSLLTMSINNELLDNIDPPSTFSNLVSSSDCILMGSPPMNPKMQGSSSDKLSRKWKAMNEAGNTSSIHSNLSGQRPPLDLDLENSMISVASIKSEIYELSSTASYTNEIFQSAVEDIASPSAEKVPGIDTSIGGNTYTIFPPENVVGENGKSTDVVSEGGNTVVSDDFTDAEEIEDFETAPADDHIGHVLQIEKHDQAEKEKSDAGKPEVVDNPKKSEEKDKVNNAASKEPASPVAQISNTVFNLTQQPTPSPKPLMEVHPLETGNKYGTFKVNRSPLSPKSSPKQKRRDDPERYKTRTIAALQAGRALMSPQSTSDNNGNPLDDDTRFATFRVGGPKIVKPAQNANSASVKSSQSNSPESTPGNSPKGIRGRRKPLYSSLPPSAIAAKKKAAPPVPPKPVRNSSPVRPPSAGSGGVYVRPTRTSELRIAANSRDNSPGRGGANSRTSSNSSLNLIQSNPSRESTPSRPKVAPKPPVRTSASSTNSSVKPFSGSTYNVLIKTSNSSFGFGQQKVGDGSVAQNMKGYSTLPKSSKLGGEFAGMYMPGSVPGSQNGESKESIPGSEKSQGKIGKLTNLFKKMDFHRHSKDANIDSHPSQYGDNNMQNEASGGNVPIAEKKSSKFSNFFGRKKDKGQPKPFLDGSVVGDITVGTGNTASIRGTSGVWVRRDGENKALVAPFNYVPPPGHAVNPNPTHQQQGKQTNNYPLSTSSSSNNNSGNVNNSRVNSENVQTSAKSAAAGSAKITTV